MSERQMMPSVDIVNFQGLFTKQNPETLEVTQLRDCKNADFFREYGSLSKMRGNRLILNQQYSETSVVKGIAWGSNYKAQDLSGAIDRQVLIGAGTTLRKLNTNGTTTQLLTGEPNELFRTAAQLDRFLYITSQDPFDVGRRGQMSKYDGTRVSQWGTTPPGSQQTSILSFNDSSVFSTFNATAADSALPAWDGEATAMTKGTASVSSYIEILNQTPVNIDNTVPDHGPTMQIFIPRADYRKLAASGRALSVYFGSSPTLANNYYRYDFQIGRLFEGWNTLTFDFFTSPSGDFGTQVGTPDDTAICSYRFEVITNNASDTLTVYWDALMNVDPGAPIPTFASPGGLVFPVAASSIWSYKVTFIDDAGFESNVGPASVEADNTGGGIDYGQIGLTNIPISTNPSIVARRLYRTLASGSEFFFLDVINDNVTTTYTDTTPDVSLSQLLPPTAGEAINDNSPPPSGGIMTIWKRTAFIAGDPLNPTLLYYSRFDLPEAFPVSNVFELDERITGIFTTYLGIVVTTENAYWRIIGDNPDYTIDKVLPGFGAVGSRAVGGAREMGWAVDRDGMRLYDMRTTLKVSEVIRDRVDDFDKQNLEHTHTCHTRKDNAVLWFTQNEAGEYEDLYMYQYMIDDMSKGWFAQIDYNPTDLNILHMWEIEDEEGEHRLYAGTSGGQVMELMAEGQMNVINDTGQVRALVMDLQTPYMRLGATDAAFKLTGNTGRVVPRFIELRIKENNGGAHTWSVTVDTSDSASENATVRDTQTLTFDFLEGQSLLRLPTKDLIPGEYMRLRLVNEELNKDLSIMGIKIYYYVKAGQFAVTGVSGFAAAGAGGQN